MSFDRPQYEYRSTMMMFRSRIHANVPQIKENNFHDNSRLIHDNSRSQEKFLERKFPLMYRKLKKILFHENSRLIYDNSRSQDKEFRVASWHRLRRPLSQAQRCAVYTARFASNSLSYSMFLNK